MIYQNEKELRDQEQPAEAEFEFMTYMEMALGQTVKHLDAAKDLLLGMVQVDPNKKRARIWNKLQSEIDDLSERIEELI